MSHVSTVFIISPHSRMPDKVVEFVSEYYAKARSFDREDWTAPAINPYDEGNDRLWSGGKCPSGSMIWLGWNYFYSDDFISALKAEGFKDLTVWYETEGEFMAVEKINCTMVDCS